MYRPLAAASLFAAIPHAFGNPIELSTRDSSRERGCSCSQTSFHELQWTVEDFDYHASYVFSTPAHQNSWGYVNFNLSNPAVPDVVASCSASSDQLEDFFYGTFWYDCTFNGTTSGPAPATFTFDRPSGELEVNQTWVCRDGDPEYPTSFTAAGRANLTLECSETQYQNPNWTLGQIYSDTEIKCQPVTVVVEPYEVTAVA